MDQSGDNSCDQHHQQSTPNPEARHEIPPPLHLLGEMSSQWHHETMLPCPLVEQAQETSMHQDFFNMLSYVEPALLPPPPPPPTLPPPSSGMILPKIESVGGGQFEKGESSGARRTSDVVQAQLQHTHGSEVSTQEAEREDQPLPPNTRRRRLAQVHNLSERTRRGRITEKIRILRELVPNCNKTDKASVLTDAIEYIKLLQQQVQAKSTYPSMLIPYYSSSAFPMRPLMGLGYGMGMYGSPSATGFPMTPFPHGLNPFGESTVFHPPQSSTMETRTPTATTSTGPTAVTTSTSTSVTSLSSTFSQGESSSTQSIPRIETDMYQAQILSQFHGSRQQGFASMAQASHIVRQPSPISADQDILHADEESQKFHHDSTEQR